MTARSEERKFSAFYEKINSQLPHINISASEVEKYPDFCVLLTKIASYIQPDGVSTQTSKDLKQAEEVLRHEKHSWLLNHILYLEVQELLLDYELKSQDISLSSRDQQFHKILQQCLTQAEIGDYLDFSPDPSSKVTTLGLSREELSAQNPYKKHLQSLQQALIPEIEERLRKKCETLVVAHDPQNSSTESTKLTFAKSSQLPAIVENDKHHLEEEKHQLKEDFVKKDKQFAAYYQKLLDSLGLLETLISKFKLEKQSEHDTITTEWLYAKCDAMCLKIRLVELQILCDTYTVETLESLKIIRKHLDDAYRDSEKEKLHRQQAIKAYDSVGDGFEEIVAEFGKMKAELENKQWALAEFDKSNEQKGTAT
ncbi:HAUS augmin-like complex subunit 4 [Mercenaria mercenaria]|uniref:HAUS augmin-like complex subunit 4 n=1 Tax=Mercenaria mercenaria TaxID=6596 RepID=UPI00234F3826|nr:HAUS augmin-like complex subunit 4 [Mercenaria mercenaria]